MGLGSAGGLRRAVDEIPGGAQLLLWRPSPLIGPIGWRSLTRIYYKYEGAPVGSHKTNSAVAQAYYNAQAGIRKLVTETGAGQWGSALAFATEAFGMECEVYQVRSTYESKPYRRVLMATFGATVYPSPSDHTATGRAMRERPTPPARHGDLEAVGVAATNEA
jgi:tryptophan synthase beta chain